ncbi:uncharacterized protein LOC120980691 [Bufo bufo]|uniref:uncharacterized protein LOC120980691 n=1 Tax=Bufo bufo TaxID=8384 RepID=UPI001ABEA4A5|nr:uncharacterized protein LOC120980691 [Bufo bufo]
MMPQTLRLSLLLSIVGISCSTDPIQVISGVFMPNNLTVDYDGAKVACAMQFSRLATLENITFAFTNGYEFCKWGWIEEKRVVMLRLTPFEACSDYNLGILMRDCPNIRSAFCVNGSSGAVLQLPIPLRLFPSYENASNTCEGKGLTIATKEQIEMNASTIADQSLAWYNWGVGQINNGTFEQDTCNDTLSQASAFCYNPALSDVLLVKDTQTWKIISIGSIIAFIFLILLMAAVFMRGNKFICCMGETHTHAPETEQAPVPTWNTTSVYRRVSHANRGAMYDSAIIREKRPSVIRPEMSHFKTHYSNMAFDTTGEV